jgi:molybdopterin synthase sulfur carrier subunit
MTRVKVLYFASLRDAARVPGETIETEARTLASFYDELRIRHQFTLPREQLRVAVDDAFATWEEALRDGSEVAFIPPVSGG